MDLCYQLGNTVETSDDSLAKYLVEESGARFNAAKPLLDDEVLSKMIIRLLSSPKYSDASVKFIHDMRCDSLVGESMLSDSLVQKFCAYSMLCNWDTNYKAKGGNFVQERISLEILADEHEADVTRNKRGLLVKAFKQRGVEKPRGSCVKNYRENKFKFNFRYRNYPNEIRIRD